jgi:hypothetical protein
MFRNKVTYSSSIDYLFASIVYLATNPSWWARSPKSLATELSLNQEKLEQVFTTFTGIYRTSHDVNKESGQHTYSLHARFAQRKDGKFGEPANTSWLGELDKEMLALIIDFVLKSAEQDRTTKRTIITNLVSGTAAVVAAITAVAVAIMKHGP